MSESSRRIVITGANRGLGLEFVRQWSERGDRVFALCRDVSSAADLSQIQEVSSGLVSLHPCDVLGDESVEEAMNQVQQQTDGIDLLVNNAGIYGEGRGVGLDQLDLQDCVRVFEANSLGPIRVTRAFRRMLQRGIKPRLVHITSLMGSIADNTGGGSWAYRMSKSALNMVGRNLAIELAPSAIPSVSMHPGWVRTDMGGTSAPLGVEEAVSSMIASIDGFSMKQSGLLVDREGKTLPF